MSERFVSGVSAKIALYKYCSFSFSLLPVLWMTARLSVVGRMAMHGLSVVKYGSPSGAAIPGRTMMSTNALSLLLSLLPEKLRFTVSALVGALYKMLVKTLYSSHWQCTTPDFSQA